MSQSCHLSDKSSCLWWCLLPFRGWDHGSAPSACSRDAGQTLLPPPGFWGAVPSSHPQGALQGPPDVCSLLVSPSQALVLCLCPSSSSGVALGGQQRPGRNPQPLPAPFHPIRASLVPLAEPPPHQSPPSPLCPPPLGCAGAVQPPQEITNLGLKGFGFFCCWRRQKSRKGASVGLGLWSWRMWLRCREAGEGERGFPPKTLGGRESSPSPSCSAAGVPRMTRTCSGRCSQPWTPGGFSLLGAAPGERSWLSPALRGVPAGIHSSAQILTLGWACSELPVLPHPRGEFCSFPCFALIYQSGVC